MSNQTFSDETFGFDEPRTKQKRSGSGCLKGCLIACVVLLLLSAIAAIVIMRNWKSWAGAIATKTVEAMVEQSKLPEAEKQEIMAEVRRAADLLAEGKMSPEQMTRLFDGFMESPLFTSFFVTAIENEYLQPSGLDEEEKAEARVTLHRLIRGAVDKQIDEETLDNLLADVTERDGQGEMTLREKISDEELRTFLANAKQAVDDAGVAEDAPPIDPSDEIRRVVDEAMSQP